MATGDQPVREEAAEPAEISAPAETGGPEDKPAEKELPMDIHPPHGPIHTKKDFFIHLLTIITGILIALGLEALITWGHHRALVHEARVKLAIEIRNNKKTLEDSLPEIRGRQKELATFIEKVREVEAGKPPSGHIGYGVSGFSLSSTAWKTAAASGATAYMDYDELEKYADIYDQQQAFLAWQDQDFKAMTDMADLRVLMDLNLKTVPKTRFEQLVTAASRAMSVHEVLISIAGDLDTQYAGFKEPD